MNFSKNYLYIEFYIFLIYIINKVTLIDIYVKNNNDYVKILNNLYSFENETDIRIIFNNTYYIIEEDFSLNISEKDITFYSENGTIFDFQKLYHINISIFDNKIKIKFQNISFCNYEHFNSQYLFSINPSLNENQIEFQSCIFKNLNGIFYFNNTNNKQYNYPNLYFNNCKFM